MHTARLLLCRAKALHNFTFMQPLDVHTSIAAIAYAQADAAAEHTGNAASEATQAAKDAASAAAGTASEYAAAGKDAAYDAAAAGQQKASEYAAAGKDAAYDAAGASRRCQRSDLQGKVHAQDKINTTETTEENS